MRVKEHLISVESPFQKIDILDTYEYGRVLVIDGFTMLTEKDEFIYHEMIAHVPMAVHPHVKNILRIGGGDGGTLRELIKYPTIEKMDFVEIDKMVVDLSKEYLPFLKSGFDDSRINFYYQDGVEFVKDKEELYDLIIVDSTDPIGPGEGLFTENFYKDAYKALKEDGILVNQCESVYFDEDRKEFERAIGSLKGYFPKPMLIKPIFPLIHQDIGYLDLPLKGMIQ